MRTTTIRVRHETRDRLASLGRRRGLSTPDLVDELARRAEEDELLAGFNDDFTAVRADAGAWADHQAETAAWDQASADGAGDA
jgi:hypothetical protein